jgi:ABC-type transporter Mla subunit MlaD
LQVLVALAGLSLLLLVGSRRKPLPGRAATAQFACVLVGVITLAALGLAGCGYASHTATTTTSYNLTVTATSGTLSHQSSVTVTVQQ